MTLPACFFTCQPLLTKLVFQYHGLLLDGDPGEPETFRGLEGLTDLCLEGCELVSWAYEYDAFKPLYTLTRLTSVNLSRTLSQTDQSLHEVHQDVSNAVGQLFEFSHLGLTSATGLLSLDLSHNGLRFVTQQLSLLKKLTSLDLRGNLLPSSSCRDVAILALPELRFLSLAGCMTACLSSHAISKELIHPDHQLMITGPWSQFAAVHRSHIAPDVSQLMQACPHLHELHVCNVA